MLSFARVAIVFCAVTFTHGWGSAVAAEPRCEAASLTEAKAMAVQAATLLVKEGPEIAFRRFSDPQDNFIDRDLYVFVLDMAGRIWFNAAFPTPPGRNILGSRDPNGRYFVQDMIAVANSDGEGWVEYEWLSPCTGEMTPKSAYVVRVGPLLVAVGAYGVLSL
jgi:cytochrome c